VKKVLVVDDSETVRQQVTQALQDSGFPVLEAADGIEGLSIATEDPDVALLILDINMPRMNGLEMLERLREKRPEVAVLVLTTEAQPSLIERARNAGAKGWLVKPIKPDTLASACTKVLS
jgi:two-component system chemotaxis response regulator CheY